MNTKELDELVSATFASAKNLLVVKGGEYAGESDRLSNFYRGAALTGVSPLQVAFIYASKHYDGIASFVRTAAAGTPRPSSEPIEGRFDDLINYCLLMKAIVKEEAWKAKSSNQASPGQRGQTTSQKDLASAASPLEFPVVNLSPADSSLLPQEWSASSSPKAPNVTLTSILAKDLP